MRTKTLLTILTMVALSVMTACGGSAHDRAGDVIDTAEGWYEDMHEQTLAIAEEYEGRLEGVDCKPFENKIWFWPGVTRETEALRTHEQFVEMRGPSADVGNLAQACESDNRSMRAIHAQIVETAGMLTPEAFDATAMDLRTRLASVDEQALTEILDNADTTEDAWAALNRVNVRSMRTQYITPRRFEEQRLSAAEEFEHHAEQRTVRRDLVLAAFAEGQAIIDSWTK